MDIITGAFVAIIILAGCLSFGAAVSHFVRKLME
jgi:hypothetical protein